jgi:nucleoside phosphorylase
MPNIGLIVAMRAEVPYMLKNPNGIYQIGDNVVRVAISGIGQKKARRATQRLCTGSLGFLPDLLINSGFCGAVRYKLDIGHLVIANRLAYQGREIQLENSPVEKIVGLLEKSEYHVGMLQTFNWPVLSRSMVTGDALAVDMESFAIAITAAKYQIPVVVIKAVSDIVPEHASLIRLLNLVRSLRSNSNTARDRLSINVNKILEDKSLMVND